MKEPYLVEIKERLYVVLSVIKPDMYTGMPRDEVAFNNELTVSFGGLVPYKCFGALAWGKTADCISLAEFGILPSHVIVI